MMEDKTVISGLLASGEQQKIHPSSVCQKIGEVKINNGGSWRKVSRNKKLVHDETDK